MGMIILPLIVAAVVIFAIAVTLYWVFYRQKINKQLHSETPHPRKLIAPWAFTIIAAFVVLIVFAGLTAIMALTDFGMDKVPAEYRNAVYDYQSFDASQKTGFRSHFSIDENPGYTKTVEQKGDIRFTVFIRNEAFNHYHPSFIVFVEYTGDKDILYYGVQGVYYAPDGREIMNSGNAGYEITDYFVVIGTSTIESTFELSAYFFDDGLRGEEYREYAVANGTITIQVPNP
jgi:hypothetical protein